MSAEIPYRYRVTTQIYILRLKIGFNQSEHILPHSVRKTIVRSTTQIWVVTHQHGISILNPQTSFCRKTSGGILGWAPASFLSISTEHR